MFNQLKAYSIQLPCNANCKKCGSTDIFRRFYPTGRDTNGGPPKKGLDSSEWVDRSDAWRQPALKDCIVHHCRCCGYQWDSNPSDQSTPVNQEFNCAPVCHTCRRCHRGACSEQSTPDTDYAFDGDLSVGHSPEVKTWAQAKKYAQELERSKQDAEELIRSKNKELELAKKNEHLANQACSDACDWFNSLVDDLKEQLSLPQDLEKTRSPVAIFEAIDRYIEVAAIADELFKHYVPNLPEYDSKRGRGNDLRDALNRLPGIIASQKHSKPVVNTRSTGTINLYSSREIGKDLPVNPPNLWRKAPLKAGRPYMEQVKITIEPCDAAPSNYQAPPVG